jgi:hypothetical protein
MVYVFHSNNNNGEDRENSVRDFELLQDVSSDAKERGANGGKLPKAESAPRPSHLVRP